MKKKYQISLIVIILMLVCTIVVATSYALWSINIAQDDSNIVTTGCFDATLNGSNPINLNNAYPIQEADGLKLTPYTFTITNTCSIAASYEISLESLAETTLGSEYLRVSLNKQISTLYSNMENVTKYYDTSKTAKFLAKGKLGVGESVSYDLRLWLDYNATLETTANKTFAAKIIVLNTATTIDTLSSQVAIGDYISMSPTSTSYTPLGEDTGCLNDENCTQNTINPSELNLWRVIKKNDDGTIDVASEYVSSTGVYFYGEVGYMNLVGGLNTIAAQYTNAKYVESTRHMGYSDQTPNCSSLSSCSSDTGYKTDTDLVKSATGTLVGKAPSNEVNSYWLASRKQGQLVGPTYEYDGYFMDLNGNPHYYGRLVYGGQGKSYVDAVRPILTLKSSLEPVSGDGKSAATAYTFE